MTTGCLMAINIAAMPHHETGNEKTNDRKSQSGLRGRE
jgi:hypothetical protein